MLDPNLVSRALAGPGMDATSAAVDDTLRLAQGGELRAAAERAALVIEDGATDARLVAAFLLGVFAERGPVSVPEILAITQGGAILNAFFLLGSSRRMLQDHLLGTVVVDLRTARPRAIDATSVARTFA